MGILDNLLTPDTFDNLALGFNSMRLNPDQNLPDMIARRQALRREAGNRQKAIDYFKNIPGSEAYIGALNAGGSGANLISNHIATLEQRKRDELEHKRAMALAAANRAPQGTATMQTVRSLIENGDLPKNTANNTAILDLIVPVTRGANGQVTNIGRPIQMPTAAKSPAIKRQMTGAELAQNLMGTGSKSTAALVGKTPDKVFDVTIDNGTITNYTPAAVTPDANKTIQMLQDAADNGDVLASTTLTQIQADPANISTILRNYYNTRSLMDRDANKVVQSKDLGNGLVQQTMGAADINGNNVRYYQDGELLTDAAEIQLAIDNADQAKVKQAREEAYAKAEGKYSGQEFSDINAAIKGVGERYAYSRDLIMRMMNHPGMAGATGSVAGLRGIGTYGEGSPEKEFITLYNQLAGQIFLGAFEGLKGGGQITELEGKTARQAAANIDRQLDAPALRKALEQYLVDIFNQHNRLTEQRKNQKANADPSALEPLPTFEPDF
jgi:hypothetical protein